MKSLPSAPPETARGLQRTDRMALVLLGLFVLVQYITTALTLQYYPDGFWTENFYHPLARNLLNHGIYGFGEAPDITPSTIRPPFYTIVLAGLYALFGESEVVGVVFNNILLAGTLILTYLIGRGLSPRIGLLAVVAIAIDSIYLSEANRNQSDMLFAFLVMLALLFALKACVRPLSLKWVSAAALALAVATFTRAAGLYLWPMLVLLLAAVHWRHEPRRKLVAAAVLVAAINAAFILPWMARNASVTGNSDYAGMKGYHITYFYAPLFIAKRDGISFAAAKRQIDREFNSLVGQKELTQGERLTPGEREKMASDYGANLVRENWVNALLVLPANIPRMFFSYASESIAVLLSEKQFNAWHARHQGDHAAGNTPTGGGLGSLLRYYVDTGLVFIIVYGALVKIVTIGVLALGGTGCILLLCARDQRKFSLGLSVFLICGILTATSIIATQGRFRLPVMPGLAVTAAYVLTEAWAWLRSRGRRSMLTSQA